MTIDDIVTYTQRRSAVLLWNVGNCQWCKFSVDARRGRFCMSCMTSFPLNVRTRQRPIKPHTTSPHLKQVRLLYRRLAGRGYL